MVEATAAQLRACQINQADSTGSDRQAMEAEVLRALGKIVPQQRQAFLRELMSRFPGAYDAPAATSTPVAPVAPAVPTNPLELAEALISQCAKSGPDVRRAVADRLRAAGLAPKSPDPVDDVNLRDLRTKLRLPADQPLDPGRLYVLLVQLVTLAENLDKMTWDVWKEIAPQNPFGRSSEMIESMARFVLEGGVVATEAVARDRERLGRLSAMLLYSITRIAAPLYSALFSGIEPTAIYANAPGMDLPVRPQKSANSWKEYSQRVRNITAKTVQSELYRKIEMHIK